eukprot:4079602-Pleurochrysis_carterae.AAC.1
MPHPSANAAPAPPPPHTQPPSPLAWAHRRWELVRLARQHQRQGRCAPRLRPQRLAHLRQRHPRPPPLPRDRQPSDQPRSCATWPPPPLNPCRRLWARWARWKAAAAARP